MEEAGSSPTNYGIEPQSARGKARLARMLQVATELFLRDGYEQTSIDAILERSGGSKATLYAYFPTKEDLFRAVIDQVVESNHQPELFDVTADPRIVLTEFAMSRLHVIMSPTHRAILGVLVGERDRFPDLARSYFERGPLRSQTLLADYLDELRRRGRLSIADTSEAAQFFIGMLKQRWAFDVLLFADAAHSESALRQHAERVADAFLTLYRPATH
jgi:AcrR family transcriptional regulator